MKQNTLRIFKKRKNKADKFFLQLYFNLDKEQYLDAEKRNLIDQVEVLAYTLFSEVDKFKYNIYGPGYGISKGDPSFGKKAFHSKFIKKGYKNCYGISIENRERNIDFHLNVEPPVRDVNFLFLHLAFPHNNVNELLISAELIKQLNNSTELAHGYGYYCPMEMSNITQTIPKKGLFSTSVSINSDYYKWENNLSKISEGYIKDLYPFNLLNSKQAALLSDIESQNQIRINDNLTIITYSPETVQQVKSEGLYNGSKWNT